MGVNFRRLGQHRRIDVDDPAISFGGLFGGFFQEYFTGNPFPTGIGVGEKMADVRLPQGAKDGVANGMHQGVGVRMAVETFGVGDFHAAQHELAAGNQLMNIVTNANVNHSYTIKTNGPVKKIFRP